MIEGLRSIGIGAFVLAFTIGFILAFNSMQGDTEEMGFDTPLGISIMFHAVFAFFLVVGAILVITGMMKLRSRPDEGTGAVTYPSDQQGPEYWRPRP